jgi:hypothetical protein
MSSSQGFWDAVRSWASSAGLLLPQSEEPGDQPPVPPAVCANCPICQGAATLDQLDHEAIADYVDLARNMVLGLGSALASAAEQRIQGGTAGPDAAPDPSGAPEPQERPVPRRVRRTPPPDSPEAGSSEA